MPARKTATVKAYKNKAKPYLKWACYYNDADGTRKRSVFKTKNEATLFCDKKNAHSEKIGKSALHLHEDLLHDAVEANKLLAGYDCTLTEAVKFYCNHQMQKKASILVEEALPHYFTDKVNEGHSKRYLDDIKSRSKKIKADFGGRYLSEIAPVEINAWVNKMPLAPQTKIHYRNLLHNIYEWAMERNYSEGNPVAKVGKIKKRPKDVEIYTPDEIVQMLSFATGDILAFIALGAFAGLRSSEILRLEWKDINLTKSLINLSASKTKTAQRRFVDIEPNLKEWLMPIYSQNNPVCGVGFERRLKIYKKHLREIKGIEFIHNGLRHSYGSYYMAATANAALTSSQLGHSSQDVVFKHYREVVTEEEGRAWFSLYPQQNNNLIEMEA